MSDTTSFTVYHQPRKETEERGRLPALPIYFQDEERIRGLMFLLTIALTLFTLMEFIVRRQLAAAQQSLSGLYPGLPKGQTNRPTAEKLLAAFSELTLYLYPDGSKEITSLNSLQRQILHSHEDYQIYLHSSSASF